MPTDFKMLSSWVETTEHAVAYSLCYCFFYQSSDDLKRFHPYRRSYGHEKVTIRYWYCRFYILSPHSTTRHRHRLARHARFPREDPREDVGVVECGLYTTFYYFAPRGDRRSMVCLFVCLSVCLSIRWHISQKSHGLNTAMFACCSVLLWRRCDTLRTSGFMDDVTFSHNGLCGTSRVW